MKIIERTEDSKEISFMKIPVNSHFTYFNGKRNLGFKLSENSYYSYYNMKEYLNKPKKCRIASIESLEITEE